MKVYIELVIIFILMVFTIFSFLLITFSKMRAAKKYDPNNDRAKKGEIYARAIDRGERISEATEEELIGNEQFERRQLFSEVPSVLPRKNSVGIRKILRRRRVKK